jgi:hypothetical protein
MEKHEQHTTLYHTEGVRWAVLEEKSSRLNLNESVGGMASGINWR